MLNLIGPVDDQFAIFATPENDESYSIVIFPELTEIEQDITIPAACMDDFVEGHAGKCQVSGSEDHADLFIHSLTAVEILQLTSLALHWRRSHRILRAA